jgi:hypothetical protein
MKSIWVLELERYKQKGYFLVPAILLYIFLFYFPVSYGKLFWEKYLDQFTSNYIHFYIISISLVHTFCVIIYFSLFLPFYIFNKNSYIKSLRVDPDSPWPWETKNWRN